MHRPRILLAVDRPGWAYAHIARQLVRHLGEEFNFTIAHRARPCEVDLLVCFSWQQLLRILGSVKARRVALLVYDHVSWCGSQDARQFFLLTCRQADVVGVANDRLAKEIEAPLPTFVVEDGVDAELFQLVPPPPMFAAMWCGNSAAVPGFDLKGISLLREACRRAEVPLRVLDLAEIRRPLPHEEMPAWYAEGSVYLCASESEGTPNPVLEAAACGRPVIMTDVGLAGKVVQEGVNGRIVPRTVEAFAAALQDLRSWPYPVAIGAAARARAEAHDWRHKIPAWRELLRAALSNTIRSSATSGRSIGAVPEAAPALTPPPAPRPARAPGSKPRVLLVSDVRGWAFDQNLQDLAAHLEDEFDFDFRYVVDWPAWQPDLRDADAVFTPYHRWSTVNEMLPWDRALGSLRASWFAPERPAAPGPAEFDLVNRYRAFHLVTRQNLEELRAHCPGAVYLTNPVNMKRFPEATRVRGVIASWNGNAGHANPMVSDVKGFHSVVLPAVQQARVGLEYAEYNTRRHSPAEMPTFYLRGSVALCASLYEGASNSVMEAMACGQAVISTDCGNVRELQESQHSHLGDTGILIIERSPKAFAQTLQELSRDPRRVKKMGEINRQEISDRWSWEAWKHRYAEFLRRALS